MRLFPNTRKTLLLLGDIFLIVFSYALLAAFYLDKMFTVFSPLLSVHLLLMLLLLQIHRLYALAYKSFMEILRGILVTALCLLALEMAFSFFWENAFYSRWILAASLFIQTVLLLLWRYGMWKLEQILHGRRKVMLLGPEEECAHIYNRLRFQPQLNMALQYVCTDTQTDLWRQAAEKVEIVILCPNVPYRCKVAVMDFCGRRGKEALLVPNPFEIFCAGASLTKIDDIPVFRPRSLLPSMEIRIIKRLLDVIVSVIGFLCTLPLLVLTAIAIKLGDPGPILYRQVRVGRDGKEFQVCKFRTMRVDAEKYSGPVLATENDPRITKLGKFLRTVRLDELPQIWNVITGDMSIVGPRPERPVFVEKFKKEIPDYSYRHNVKPGITGLAQVCGKYNTTVEDKLAYDLMYIQNCSLLEDLTIILQTVRVLFTKSATEGIGEQKKSMDLERFAIPENKGKIGRAFGGNP